MFTIFFKMLFILKLRLYKYVVAKLVVSLLFCVLFISLKGQKTKILHFGWDNPDVERLCDSIDFMQNTPFDGICVSFQEYIMEAFDTTVQKDSYFKYDKLRCIKWGRYTDNYLFLRGMSKTGGSWFNNKAWIAIVKNMNGVSMALKEGKLKGILFDSEYYYKNQYYNPWTYSKEQYPEYSFIEVQTQVRERGKQFIKALQKNTANFSFLSIWLGSLIADDRKFMPFEKTRQSLLISFIEGILLAKKNGVKIIDGNEFGYWYSKPSQFLESTDYLKKNTLELMRSPKAKELAKQIQIAQPVFYDGIFATHTSFERGFKNIPKWNWLQENLKYAIAASNSNLVWFYSERLNWWKNKVNDTIITILNKGNINFTSIPKNARSINKNILTDNWHNINSQMGNYYFTDAKTPMKMGGIAFEYDYNLKTNILLIKFIDTIPLTVTIFLNNKLSVSINPKLLKNEIKLNGFTKGTIAILSKYANDMEACSLHIY